MTATIIKPKPNLEEFLKLPETKPASEFINGEIIQKDMPQGEHSRLQAKLCTVINEITETPKIAYAFPELRCTFDGESIIPDISVFRWERIPILPSGKISNRFEIHPDWAIEIVSPDQNQTKIISKLLHCSRNGTELGWLIDSQIETILVMFPGQKIELFTGSTQLPVLAGIDLQLTVEQVFSWLNFS